MLPAHPLLYKRILGQKESKLILWYIALATLGPDSAGAYQVRFNAQTLTRSLFHLWTDLAILYVVSLASFGLVNNISTCIDDSDSIYELI